MSQPKDEVFGLRLTDFEPPVESDRDDRERLLSGPSWFVWKDGDVLMLSYLSGEHGGGARAIAIDERDFALLQSDKSAIDRVLIRHHAS